MEEKKVDMTGNENKADKTRKAGEKKSIGMNIGLGIGGATVAGAGAGVQILNALRDENNDDDVAAGEGLFGNQEQKVDDSSDNTIIEVDPIDDNVIDKAHIDDDMVEEASNDDVIIELEPINEDEIDEVLVDGDEINDDIIEGGEIDEETVEDVIGEDDIVDDVDSLPDQDYGGDSLEAMGEPEIVEDMPNEEYNDEMASLDNVDAIEDPLDDTMMI